MERDAKSSAEKSESERRAQLLSAQRVLLERADYPLRVTAEDRLSAAQRVLLRRYGYWLAALADGDIEPATDAQTNFCEVARGARAPVTEHEVAWVRLQQLRRKERVEPSDRVLREAEAARAKVEELAVQTGVRLAERILEDPGRFLAESAGGAELQCEAIAEKLLPAVARGSTSAANALTTLRVACERAAAELHAVLGREKGVSYSDVLSAYTRAAACGSAKARQWLTEQELGPVKTSAIFEVAKKFDLIDVYDEAWLANAIPESWYTEPFSGSNEKKQEDGSGWEESPEWSEEEAE